MSLISYWFSRTQKKSFSQGAKHGRDHKVVRFLTTCAINAYYRSRFFLYLVSSINHVVVEFTFAIQSAPITTKVVSSNPDNGKVYSIQHFVINFISDFRKRSVVFSRYSGFLYKKNWPPGYNWNIVESGIKHHINP
jgi:hypothetical protein